MLVSCSEMRAIEERAFAAGLTAEALMEDAGRQIARAVHQFIPRPGMCIVFFGKGHNGGDALVAARHLQRNGWQLQFRAAFAQEDWSELTLVQFSRIAPEGEGERPLLLSTPPLVVLDGLLGTGAGGTLREPVRGACRELNRLRRENHAHVFALDLPSGLDGDSGAADADAVVADVTLTIGLPKAGLVADSAVRHVGRLAVLPLEGLPVEEAEHATTVTTPRALVPLLPRRAFDVHKGNCGRVGIFAGSPGLTGAAVICAEGAVRGGAGLVSLYVPQTVHAIVAAQTSPEVMVRPLDQPLALAEMDRDVLAIGPGLGRENGGAVLKLIAQAAQPMILDADALNIVASDLTVLDWCAGPRLLTPHPGEMARLDPDSTHSSRRGTAEKFTARFPHTLLLKGARSIIAERGRGHSYNPTGHPGLATGGIGDALTGLLAALVAQGLSLYDAARLGAWLIGRAAELAIASGRDSAESLRATVVLDHFGRAFHELRGGGY